MNVLFVYRIIVSEFCRIGKWGNDRWMGGRNFGINFEFVEFFGGWLEDFVGEVENWEIWRGFCLGGVKLGDWLEVLEGRERIWD